ncbi:LamG domain-containing protein [Streptomyces sp. NPDC002574]|uniref:LamG domain-containing protein n=1 Tax=Streptomyces sp. NPDC002574 TaxID=3364652 RepID=UPI0036993E69
MRALSGVIAAVLLVGGSPLLVVNAHAAGAPAQGVRSAKASGDESSGDVVTEAEALAQAAASGKSVEVTSRRGEANEVFAEPDGSFTAVEHVKPVRTLRGGKWVPIDTTLRKVDGVVAPAATALDVAFSGGGSDPLIRVRQSGRELRLSWPTSLPEPELDGATATYKSVLPGVDLKVTAQDSAVSESIVVRTPEAAQNPELQQLKLLIGTDGLEVREDASGGYQAVDEDTGSVLLATPTPMMWDSAQTTAASPSSSARTSKSAVAQGSEDDAPHMAPVDLAVDTDASALVLTPDQELLHGPDTHFPLVIDPLTTTPKAPDWAGVSRHWSDTSFWHFSGDPDFGMGYCGDTQYCAPQDLKRVFFQFPASKFAGQHILEATFIAHETHSYSCSAKSVELWQTKPIKSSTDWNAQNASGFWTNFLEKSTFAHGWSSDCPAANVEFAASPVKSIVQTAANAAWPTITFGLKAFDEDDLLGWKRWADDASLRVKYNLPPKQPVASDLTMSPGSVCQSTAVRINRRPQITAKKLTDPNPEKIGAQFATAWDAGDGKGMIRRWWSTGAEGTAPSSGSFKDSGSQFSITPPTSAVPSGKTVRWYVRAWDGGEWGKWNADPGCVFVYDATAPDGPKITSTDYPGSDELTDELPLTVGIGRYGAFTFDSVATDVVSYRWGLDAEATSAHQLPTSGGAAQKITLLPAEEGIHFLSVVALDANNNASQPETYYFKVRRGQPERAGWALDEAAGATTASGRGGSYQLDLGAGAVLGEAGHEGSGLTLRGSDAYAESPGALVDIPGNFTVSAWAKIDDLNTSRTVVSQAGNENSGFTLGYVGGTVNKWAMRFPTTDDSTAAINSQMAVSDAAVTPGEWTHLVGVYSASGHTATVYVNGVPGPTATVTAINARGNFQVGRLQWKKAWSDPWAGQIDDLRVWDRTSTDAMVLQLYTDGVMTSGRPTMAIWSMEDTVGPLRGAGEVQDFTLDGGVEAGKSGAAGTAIHFDGATAYGAMGRETVDTNRSFSVAAWVKLEDDSHNQAAVSQSGTSYGSYMLGYEVTRNKWGFRLPDKDGTGAAFQGVYSSVPVDLGEWTHLLGVYDAQTGQITLYVNGVPSAPVAAPSVWEAHAGVQLGRYRYQDGYTDYWKGSIDDVKIFGRVVTAAEAADTVKQRPQVTGRWMLNSASGTPLVTPDDVDNRYPATLNAGAAIDSDSALVGPGDLKLNGGAYASTAASPVHTNQSFTVAGWADMGGLGPVCQAPKALGDCDLTVLSMQGKTSSPFHSAFTVRWHVTGYSEDSGSPAPGVWQVAVPDADTSSAQWKTAEHSYSSDGTFGSWNHLAVVYDAFANELRLYVNGDLQQSEVATSITPDVKPFDGAGGLQFGRTWSAGAAKEYYTGLIDDVWAYQGILSDAQIEMLANSAELPSEPES